MRVGEYFEIGKRMKQARTNAGINQHDMSSRLSLANSSYSKSPTTSSTGGLILALQRAILLLAPQGGIASISTGPL